MQLPEKVTGFRSTAINALIDFCESLQPVRSSSVRHNWTKHGVSYDVDVAAGGIDDSTVWAFGWTVAGNVATISEGVIQLGDASHEVAAGTVTLSGATEYIYVYHKKDHSGSGFGHSSTLPTSAGDEWRFILAKLTALGSTWMEVWTGHKGNIILAAPTA